MVQEIIKYSTRVKSTAAYLTRCSDVLVICMVSPVTRCSTTVANNDTTYRCTVMMDTEDKYITSKSTALVMKDQKMEQRHSMLPTI